ncbi:Fungalysin metallopeptidase-domain-containing protein [Geranomyces variabilis]|nr:Fungalysin metallopeptidase-domain-containing protein [Geranomyces variabilis]KAJ3138954.1 Fungalysin/Thermolysin Extracellular metalloproteinase 5 [Geranomyces variabilis]
MARHFAVATLSVALASSVLAHPLVARQGPAQPGDSVTYHQLPAKSWTPPASRSLKSDPVPAEQMPAAAAAWLTNTFNNSGGQMANGYLDEHSGTYHYYSVQTVDGLQVVNAVSDVHMDPFGNAITGSDSFAPIHKLTRRDLTVTTPITASQAVESYAKAFGLATSTLTETQNADGSTTVTGAPFVVSNIKAELKLYHTPTDTLEKVWSLTVPRSDAYHNAFVSAADGTLVGNSNWQSANFWNPPASSSRQTPVKRAVHTGEPLDHVEMISAVSKLHRRQAAAGNTSATAIPQTNYRAIPFGGLDLDATPPILLQDPFDPATSPLGWHDMGDGNGPLATTVGNNVIAQENRANKANPVQNSRPISNTFNFDFKADDKTQQPPTYQDASITNMFFLANHYHDVLYNYGFTERAGNFQVNNNGKGGAGQDPVIANAQDGSGTDNANFATPPDGTVGTMRMFVFTATNPQRDGTLENDIPLHELTHGLSTRLTGGPANSNCLNTLLSGGMGEGWSDYFGVSLSLTAKNSRATNFAVGTYVTNDPKGVRGVPYSTSLTTNTLKYSTLNDPKFAEVHQIGTVWNSMLYEAYWNMVDAKGFSADFANAKSGSGNALMTQYIVDGLKLQPCNPNMIQARDAIIAAEQALTKGANQCFLWAGFAKRGLGFKAVNPTGNQQFVDDSTLPPACAGASPTGQTGAGTGTAGTGTAGTGAGTGATDTGATTGAGNTGTTTPAGKTGTGAKTGTAKTGTAKTGGAAKGTTATSATPATGATTGAGGALADDGEVAANPDDAENAAGLL